MAGGGRRGGILGLLVLIEEHRAAVEYDFRTRFPGVTGGAEAIPAEVGWGEALRLLTTLRKDPSSAVAASMEGWEFAMSREALLLADLFDLNQATGGVKRPKSHPGRPWKTVGKTKRLGDVGGRSVGAVKDLLARARLGSA